MTNVDTDVGGMIGIVSSILGKCLTGDTQAIDARLCDTVDVLMRGDTDSGSSMSDSRDSPVVTHASSQAQRPKTDRWSFHGRAEEMYMGLKKLRKSVKADK